MLKNLVIFVLCIVAINASGEFYVLKAPESLTFKGEEKLNSECLGDVISASLGYCVDDDNTNWSGLYVNNPFETAKRAFALVVKGLDSLNINSEAKSYSTAGSSSDESLNALSSEFESSNISVGFFDFTQSNDYFATFTDTFGDTPSQLAPIKSTNSLKPDLHSEDKEFLTQLGYIYQLIEKYRTSTQRPTLLSIVLSVEPIARAHGSKSQAMAECRKMVSKMMEKLRTTIIETSKGDCLLVAVAEKNDPNRSKREAIDGDQLKALNLATYYNDDYPVIFNIILWFMVVLAFSLIAICYAIGSMDPGRDSIIYRMTSTRMKKDN